MLPTGELLVSIKPFQSKEWCRHKPKHWKKKKPAEKRSQVLQDRLEGVVEDCVTSDSALLPLKEKKKGNLWPMSNSTMRNKIRQFASPKDTDKSCVYINWHPLLNFPCSWITPSPHIFCRVLTIMKKRIQIQQRKMSVYDTHPTHIWDFK